MEEARSDANLEIYAAELRELEASYRSLFPKIDEQLTLRGRPIQDYWTGFGRGLMAHVKRLTEPDWLVPNATAVLVQPIRTGDGLAFPSSKSLFVEAMLTNVSPEVPEVLRVAWLASQLGMREIASSPDLTLSKLPSIVEIAMMTCTLAAGEVLDLCRCDEVTIVKAIDLWRLHPLDSNTTPEFIAATAIGWWETYLQTRPTLSVSLVALNKMLQQR